MRNAILGFSLIGLCGIAGCESKPAPASTSVERDAVPVVEAAAFNVAGAPTVAFSVPDMMCEDSCVPAVLETLAKQPGVKEVQVVLESKTATVAVDQDKFDPNAAVAALVDLQFTNTKLAAPEKAAN